MLTVGELKQILAQHEDYESIAIASDEECNTIRKAGSADLIHVEDVNQYHMEEIHEDDVEGDEDQILLIW